MATTNRDPVQVVLSLPHVFDRIIGYVDASQVTDLLFINQQWFASGCRFVFRHAKVNVTHGGRPILPWPLRRSETGVLIADIERFRTVALEMLRTISLRPHLHNLCAEVDIPWNKALSIESLRYDYNSAMRSNSCGCAQAFSPRSVVLNPLRTLSVPTKPVIHFGPSTRRLVILLIPPYRAPDQYPVYANLPAAVRDIVVCFWNNHPSSHIRTWGTPFSGRVRDRSWGPDKLAGHLANMILSSSDRTYTFVGCDALDETWLGQPSGVGVAQEAFEALVQKEMTSKLVKRDKLNEIGDWEGRVRFLDKETYLAEGRWKDEFSQEEADLHL